MSSAKKPAAHKATTTTTTDAPALTTEQAAELAGVPVEEVLAFRDHGTHVNVVTRDGRKHRCEAGA